MSDTKEKRKIIFPIFGDQRLQPKDRLNEGMLYIFFKDASEEVRKLLGLTPMEILDLAIDSDELQKDISPFDIAKQHFANDVYHLVRLAEMMEHREKYIHLLK